MLHGCPRRHAEFRPGNTGRDLRCAALPSQVMIVPSSTRVIPFASLRAPSRPGWPRVNAAPRLSIGLPVYNGERHLDESIEALLGTEL